jgi:hypothetical protein
MHRTEEPSLNAILADLLRGKNVSKRDAVQFFQNKKLQFNSIEDCVVSYQGVREYSASGDEHNILAAGVLTCLLHAIRLLFVDGLLTASDAQYRKYQELLTIMVSRMKSWKVAEVMKGLKLDSSCAETDCFQSFIEKVQGVCTGLFTVLPTIPWSSFSDLESYQRTVKDLYFSCIDEQQRSNHIFFLSFSGMPSDRLPLPYLFHCSFSSLGEIETPSETTLQLVGLIYCCSNGEYSFSFVTYARCRMYGQYEVFIKEQADDVCPSHFVPYRKLNRFTHKVEYPPPCPVFSVDSNGRPLVGLILVRTGNQRDESNPLFLVEPIIRRIVGKGLGHSNITSSALRILDSPREWLGDELVHGATFLMFNHLLSTTSGGSTKDNTIYICSSLAFENNIKKDKPLSKFPARIKGFAFTLYIINIENSHWVCACAPMNKELSANAKKIYVLDSMNERATAREQGQFLVKFFEDQLQLPGYEPILLPSSAQNDNVSCGLFTILNATIVLTSILQGRDLKELLQRKPREFSNDEKFALRQSVKSILHGTEDASSLLKWV